MAGNLTNPIPMESGGPLVPQGLGGGFGLPAAPEPAEEGVNWPRYIAALRRYKWLVVLIIITGTGLGITATRFLKPEYTAGATIWIEPKPSQQGPIRAEELLQSVAWIELLKTGAVLDSAAVKMKLYLTPAEARDSAVFRDFSLGERFATGSMVLTIDHTGTKYELKNRQGLLLESGTVGDSIGRSVGFHWTPTAKVLGRDRTIAFSVTSPRDAASALGSQLSTRMAEDANFLRLTLTGKNPYRIAAALNTVAEQFVEVAADLKRRKLTILAATLQEQVEYASGQLREAENRLESYRVKTITLPNEGVPVAAGLQMTQPTVITNYFNQKVQAEELRRDRTAIEAVLDKAKQGALAVDAFQQIPAVQHAPDLTEALKELSTAEAELRALRYRYTDEHKPVKDIQEKIAKLRQETIPAYATALVDQLKSQEATLSTQIATASKDLQEIPVRTITEERLKREKDAAETLFQTLQNRYEETKLALASAIPDVKILDAAVPPTQPTSNSAPKIIMMAFMASVGAALGLAILLDQVDKRFRYPEQVTHELGLSILGAIPAIGKSSSRDAKREETSQVVEAFRTIRLNLAHCYGTAGPVMMTVSSPGPGDGKSFVSSNLALSFAEAGYRTLLIDGDIRRGELHRMFGLDRRPGLVDYLMGTDQLSDVLRPSAHKGLSVIACGSRRHQGPELLGSQAMTRLMAEIKTHFNVIIVDSPPLGAGIDPFVLGTATGHIMVVLRSGETDRQMAEAKLRLIDRLPIRVLGAVMNDVRADGAYRYYSYVYGYAAEEEAPIAQISARSGNGES
jgi:capsular exopolysaccharide synthesis family protein